ADAIERVVVEDGTDEPRKIHNADIHFRQAVLIQAQHRIDRSRHANARPELIERHLQTVFAARQSGKLKSSPLVRESGTGTKPDDDARHANVPLIVDAVEVQITKDTAGHA